MITLSFSIAKLILSELFPRRGIVSLLLLSVKQMYWFRMSTLYRGNTSVYLKKMTLIQNTPMEVTTNIVLGDCTEKLQDLANNSVDLIFTSPPYADQRKNSYGGIHPDKYVDWFLPISEELLRVLKPTGTFILNIKERVVNGERHTYVLELIMEMRRQGWFWTEEFIWHKKNSYPGKWPNRFRDSWERLLQFNKSKKFTMYQESVMVPMGDESKAGKRFW